MIKIEGISKSFKDTNVLNDVSFGIEKGDFTAVMGPSGSGKSTLLYSVSGMDKISAGQVIFEGVNISELSEKELASFRLMKMGFVFQNAQMLKNLSIYDNIILPGLVARKEQPEKIRKWASELMERMAISGIENRDIKEVSGGQLQRASICRAMINNPDILFLDEPTGALNSEATDQVLGMLAELNSEGTTIMIVTHDSRVAAKAKSILYIRDGQIAASKELRKDGDSALELDKWLKAVHA